MMKSFVLKCPVPGALPAQWKQISSTYDHPYHRAVPAPVKTVRGSPSAAGAASTAVPAAAVRYALILAVGAVLLFAPAQAVLSSAVARMQAPAHTRIAVDQIPVPAHIRTAVDRIPVPVHMWAAAIPAHSAVPIEIAAALLLAAVPEVHLPAP